MSFLIFSRCCQIPVLAFNVTGWPAGVVRGGSSEEGLPVAVQVVGRPWREDVVLAVLEVVERETSGWIEPNF